MRLNNEAASETEPPSHSGDNGEEIPDEPEVGVYGEEDTENSPPADEPDNVLDTVEDVPVQISGTDRTI